MLAEWSAACGPEDPVLVVPWSAASATATTDVRFINLRTHPYDLAELFEAEDYPALRRALRSLNATNSAFLTAKCDVWTLSPEDGGEVLESKGLEMDLADDEFQRLILPVEPALERHLGLEAHGGDRVAELVGDAGGDTTHRRQTLVGRHPARQHLGFPPRRDQAVPRIV